MIISHERPKNVSSITQFESLENSILRLQKKRNLTENASFIFFLILKQIYTTRTIRLLIKYEMTNHKTYLHFIYLCLFL